MPYCHRCGEEFVYDNFEVSRHTSTTSPNGYDYDADADHVAYTIEGDHKTVTVRASARWPGRWDVDSPIRRESTSGFGSKEDAMEYAHTVGANTIIEYVN